MKNTFELNRAFCCPSFQNNIESAGQRGFSVLVRRDKDGVNFTLQMRAITFAEEASFPQKPLPGMPTHITLSGGMRIHYCSACGRKLQELIKASPEAFAELAEKHKQFYTGP